MTGCIPGSTDEQLPAHILDLLSPYSLTYRSTACEAAGQLARLHGDLYFRSQHTDKPLPDPYLLGQLNSWRKTMHNRCRLTNKFTGVPCACACHHPDAS